MAGRILIIAGVALIVAGSLILAYNKLSPQLPDRFKPGNLPGDIHIEKDNFSFYFPLTTCILVSLVISAVVGIVNYLFILFL